MDYKFIEDLDQSRDDWIIQARIVRMWDVYNMNNEDDQFYIEMILLDELVSLSINQEIIKR